MFLYKLIYNVKNKYMQSKFICTCKSQNEYILNTYKVKININLNLIYKVKINIYRPIRSKCINVKLKYKYVTLLPVCSLYRNVIQNRQIIVWV